MEKEERGDHCEVARAFNSKRRRNERKRGGEGERGRARYTHLSFHSSRQDKKKKKKKNDDEEREEKEAFLLELARRLSLASGIKTFQYGHFLIKSSSSRSNIEAWA